jgi:transketolase
MISKEAKLVKNIHSPEQIPTRNGYGDALLQLGKEDPKTLVLCADLTESTRSDKFAKAFPERFIEVGVAEQNLVGTACGLALEGFTAWTASYATFNPGRSWDQIRVSGCYNNVNLKIAGCHAGISVGPDGATHQALEDIATMRVLPNMTVVVPCDYHETFKATLAVGKAKGPGYVRLGRSATPVMTTKQTPFKIGKAYTMKDGYDVALIGAGSVLHDALMAAEELEKEGISVRVVNCHTIKPIDRGAIKKAAQECGAVVTVEEHQINGGVGSAIMEVIAEEYPVPVERVGMPDTFGESGEPRELIEKYGMDAKAMIAAVRKVLKRK